MSYYLHISSLSSAYFLLHRLAEYIENGPARKKAQQEAQRAKLEALERKLGITPSADGTTASVSTSEPVAGKKHRLEDTEYIEQSREIVDNVKSAVMAGMLKKKKKAKTTASPPAASTSATVAQKAVSTAAVATTSAAAAASTVAENVLASPATAPAAVAVSAVAGLAAA